SVSLPMLNPTSPPDVAAPGPADDPLAPCARFHGFRVLPPNQTSPQASSPSASFAISTAPAASKRVTTVASTSKCCARKGGVPHVVGYPRTANRSFAPQGTPCSGPRYCP